MFERFTDRARKVMALANQEAHRLQHDYIGTEHVLLALIREGTGVGINVLKNLNVDLAALRANVVKHLDTGPRPVSSGKLPNTESAKDVIKYAVVEARSLSHNYVGTEHLLLGMLYTSEGAGWALTAAGVDLVSARREVVRLVGGKVRLQAEEVSTAPPLPPWALMTDVLIATLEEWIEMQEAEQARRAAGGDAEAPDRYSASIAKARELLGLLERDNA